MFLSVNSSPNYQLSVFDLKGLNTTYQTFACSKTKIKTVGKAVYVPS